MVKDSNIASGVIINRRWHSIPTILWYISAQWLCQSGCWDLLLRFNDLSCHVTLIKEHVHYATMCWPKCLWVVVHLRSNDLDCCSPKAFNQTIIWQASFTWLLCLWMYIRKNQSRAKLAWSSKPSWGRWPFLTFLNALESYNLVTYHTSNKHDCRSVKRRSYALSSIHHIWNQSKLD